MKLYCNYTMKSVYTSIRTMAKYDEIDFSYVIHISNYKKKDDYYEISREDRVHFFNISHDLLLSIDFNIELEKTRGKICGFYIKNFRQKRTLTYKDEEKYILERTKKSLSDLFYQIYDSHDYIALLLLINLFELCYATSIVHIDRDNMLELYWDKVISKRRDERPFNTLDSLDYIRQKGLINTLIPVTHYSELMGYYVKIDDINIGYYNNLCHKFGSFDIQTGDRLIVLCDEIIRENNKILYKDKIKKIILENVMFDITLAHELGHLCFDSINDSFLRLKKEQEKEANLICSITFLGFLDSAIKKLTDEQSDAYKNPILYDYLTKKLLYRKMTDLDNLFGKII